MENPELRTDDREFYAGSVDYFDEANQFVRDAREQRDRQNTGERGR